MGLEWVPLVLVAVVALWLGTQACRESKRLEARLDRVIRRHRESTEAGVPTEDASNVDTSNVAPERSPVGARSRS
ncbi:hypothetical protein GCM10023321_16360 [Pseudonocardia eucalypti]|uniref:Uncharacterized protein n=1 Tax=Pseudonocardia eucalypti TaxID=648755 RepID=A0ABP9PQR7_9PSEU